MRTGREINKRFLKGKSLTTEELEWLSEHYEHAAFFLNSVDDPSFKLTVDELYNRSSIVFGYISNRS